VVCSAIDLQALPILSQVLGLSHRGLRRISRDALFGRAAAPITVRAVPVAPVAASQPRQQLGGGLAVPEGLSGIQELIEAEEFTIRWPKTGGGHEEIYPTAWRGVVVPNKVKMDAKVSQCIRHDKGRRTILLDKNPVAEFVETSDGRWASVIKPDGKKTLAMGEEAPPLYLNARVGSYHDATGLSGIGVPKGMAIILSSARRTTRLRPYSIAGGAARIATCASRSAGPAARAASSAAWSRGTRSGTPIGRIPKSSASGPAAPPTKVEAGAPESVHPRPLPTDGPLV
jgi:hypothetical protein